MYVNHVVYVLWDKVGLSIFVQNNDLGLWTRRLGEEANRSRGGHKTERCPL